MISDCIKSMINTKYEAFRVPTEEVYITNLSIIESFLKQYRNKPVERFDIIDKAPYPLLPDRYEQTLMSHKDFISHDYLRYENGDVYLSYSTQKRGQNGGNQVESKRIKLHQVVAIKFRDKNHDFLENIQIRDVTWNYLFKKKDKFLKFFHKVRVEYFS